MRCCRRGKGSCHTGCRRSSSSSRDRSNSILSHTADNTSCSARSSSFAVGHRYDAGGVY